MSILKKYDVVIIGGSYSGLSAAMALGRARRTVLIIDSGKPCNASAPHSHNFLTQDGVEPSMIADIGKHQVLAYPSVTYVNGLVTAVNGSDYNFQVSVSSGEVYTSSKLLFATGVKDVLPKTPGFKECWGKSIIHCPYCHGYEYADQATGIIANGDMAFEFGRLIRNWSQNLTIFTNGASTISKEHASLLQDLNVTIETGLILDLEHQSGFIKSAHLEDGLIVPLQVLYAKIPFEQHFAGIVEIGCELTQDGFVKVDDFLKTGVPGIYAVGDCITPLRSVAGAVASGSKAGAMLNHEIIAQL
jgi:thioredoxin reductase